MEITVNLGHNKIRKLKLLENMEKIHGKNIQTF